MFSRSELASFGAANGWCYDCFGHCSRLLSAALLRLLIRLVFRCVPPDPIGTLVERACPNLLASDEQEHRNRDCRGQQSGKAPRELSFAPGHGELLQCDDNHHVCADKESPPDHLR